MWMSFNYLFIEITLAMTFVARVIFILLHLIIIIGKK